MFDIQRLKIKTVYVVIAADILSSSHMHIMRTYF